MTVEEFYGQLLCLSTPWIVSVVELSVADEAVLVRVEHDASLGELCCGKCGAAGPVYDHGSERRWRHLDSCGVVTYLVTRVPRVTCAACGVRSVRVPWSEPSSRFTLAFEQLAIFVLQMCQVQSKAAELLRLSDHQVRRVMTRAVKRGLDRRVETDRDLLFPFLGMDEKSIQRGHNYLTILTDVQGRRVLEVAVGRTKDAACKLLKTSLNPAQRDSVQAVAMDMWKAFAGACEKVLPQAEIVHDRFHITQYLNHAVDVTRRREHRQLDRLNRIEACRTSTKSAPSPLNKTKFVWLKNEANLTVKQRAILDSLRHDKLETVQVWGCKEAFREFFNCSTEDQGQAFFDNWCQSATDLNNPALNNVVRLLKAHQKGLLAYLKHRITNGPAENMNGRIQQIKVNARGFRKPENFRIAILFFLGKLSLCPLKNS